jgi:hypothetical protein
MWEGGERAHRHPRIHVQQASALAPPRAVAGTVPWTVDNREVESVLRNRRGRCGRQLPLARAACGLPSRERRHTDRPARHRWTGAHMRQALMRMQTRCTRAGSPRGRREGSRWRHRAGPGFCGRGWGRLGEAVIATASQQGNWKEAGSDKQAAAAVVAAKSGPGGGGGGAQARGGQQPRPSPEAPAGWRAVSQGWGLYRSLWVAGQPGALAPDALQGVEQYVAVHKGAHFQRDARQSDGVLWGRWGAGRVGGGVVGSAARAQRPAGVCATALQPLIAIHTTTKRQARTGRRAGAQAERSSCGKLAVRGGSRLRCTREKC